ncbi:glycoside hydrolase [Paenibacillus sp. Soil787]|uniref:glycoside hydrolase n=1 Tax=Paenibacillus sp. Soil787 TaxID=1736411 RepID=UPI0006FD9E34|nr:glycoside hydrolase [Paenibacillus sp. Soil787]KRF43901.1 hypothetical protein ASG93_03015 [Paenibacillus sp. Soil787]
MLKRTLAMITSVLVAVSPIASTATHAADVNRTLVNINASSTFQTIDNFGASDAWSMDPIGKEWSESNKEKIADLLFSQDKGIGLSGWRFNIGAGSSDTDEGIITIPWRRAESFKKDENSAYDWSKQAGQQWFLKAANDRGVKDLIGFVNSPPVWMTKNGHAQPDASVGSTNLKSGYEGKFAGFLADVMDHFDKSGIHFNYVSPINEPTWDWNGAGQEANRYNNTDIINVINSLYAELQNKNLMTKISAPDGVEILSLLDDAKYAQFMATSQNPNDNKLQYQGGSNKLNVGKYREYIKDLLGNPEIASKISNKIASHSYWSDTVSDRNGDRLGELRKLLWENIQSTLPGSSYWMSEYCILGDVGEMQGNGRDLGIDPALLIARTIHYDLSVANASAWQWWTAVSKGDYKDGLIYTDYGMPGDEQSIYTSKMLWALGNYSKFIRPGAKRIAMSGLAENDPKGLMGSAYLHESNHKLTSVYVNYTNEDKPVTVQLNSLPDGKKVYHLTPYVTNANESLAQHDMVTADADGTFQYTIPARSIVTLDGSYVSTDQAPEKPGIDSVKSLNKAAEIKIHEVAGAESYKIVYGTSPDNMNMTAGPVTGTNYTLLGLENQSAYYLQAIAVNRNGDSSPSDTVSVTPKLSPPQQVSANPVDGGVEIGFSGDPHVPHYLAKWGTASGTYIGTVEIAGQDGLYKGSLTGLTNGSSYYLVIQAQDGAESSTLSPEMTVMPTVQPPSKLITIPGDGKVQLEFPEVQGVTRYSLEMTTENGEPTILELPTNSATVDHLTNGQSYSFRVSSVGVGGVGQPTANIQATPQAEAITWEDDFQNSSMSSYNPDVSVWNIENGLLKHQSGGDNQGELSIKNVNIIDGTISVTAKHSELGADWGIVFRGTDYNHAYSFVFENDALFLRKNGTNLTKPKAFSAKLNQLYQLKIVLDGPHIQAYSDGELIFDVLDSTYSSGMVGLHSWSNAQFSYLKVTRADGLMKAPEIYTVHIGNHRIDLKYAEVDGATAYTVQYGTTSDNLQNTLAVSGGNAAVTGLSNNQVYYFKVVATNGSIQTESSVKSGVPRDIQEPQLLYYVDAGDGSPGTLEDGESFGALNGVEDQAYGVDPVTGNMWGYAADGDATWARTDASGNFETIRQYDGNDLNKGLAYKFNLPNGTYRVTVGFFDPWHDSNRKMDLTINGTTKLTDYVIGNSQEAKQFDSIPVSNGQLEVKVIKKAGPKPMLSWIKVEKDLLYYVDAGDSSPVKLEAGEEFGVRNGVEDQAYQEDPVTGYKWGYDADDSQTWANQNEDRWNSIRQYDGSTNGKGLSYRFEVPNGMYNLDLGFDDPWDSSDRVMDLEVEGQKVLTNYLTGSGQDVKRVVGISVTDGELDVKITKQGNSKPLISWLTVQHDNGIPVQPVIKRVVEGDSKVTLYFDETLNATYDLAYGTDQGSLTHHVSVSGNVNHYTAQNLTNGTPYYFALATVRGDLSSPLSDVKTSTPVGPADPNLYYFVDAGATAVQNGVTLGVKQSVPDQIFGVDPISGKSWGYVADDGKTWAKSDETDPYLSIRQYDGNDNGKGIAYKFEVPHGTYTVQMGFDDPWDSSSRLMDISIQNDLKLQNYVVGDKREIKEFTVDVDTDQLEVKLVKAGSDKPAVGWISVRYVKPLPPPVNTGPKLWYKFNEGSGTTVGDSTGNGHTGTLSEGASWGTANNGSGAVTLNGVGGFVQLPNGILSDITDVTVATNVFIDPTVSNPYWIFTFGSADDPASAPGTKYFGMLTDGSGSSRVSITNDRWSAEQNVSKGSSIAKGVWKNVAVTLSGTTMAFYEDGNKIAEKSNVTLSPKDMEATIANYIGKPAYPADHYLKGQISDFRLYNRALSADEIKHVWMESLTDSEAVQAVKDGLNLGDTTAVVSNLTLPITYAAGVNITWSSDRTDIITVDGKVTRPLDADTTVHLTASISKGSATDTKTITVTVLKAGDVVGLDSRSYVLFFNQAHETKVTVTHPNGSVEDVTGLATYESSDSNVAKVDGSGRVMGLHKGTAVITVTYKGETYPVTVTVQNEMLLWYKLDETSGTSAIDSSGNGNDGVLKNGATWGQGIGGSSLQLSGGYNGAYVQMPNNLLQGVDDLTISAFMKMDATATAPQWLATFSNTTNGYIYFAPTLSGKFRYAITPTNWSGESGVASSSIPVNSWRQVAVTYSSVTGTATLYVDGVAVQTNEISKKPSSLEPTNANFIGKPWPNYGDPYFKGNVSDFRLYSRALNASEIQVIYGSKLGDMFITDQMDLTLGDTSAVQDNLTLPSRGLYGSAITWTSSNEAVVNSQTGAVTRPAAVSGNATVTLTATLSNGQATATKTFTVTVMKQLADAEKLKHDAEKLTVHNIDDVRGNLTLPVQGDYGSLISWHSEDAAVVTPTGEVKRPVSGSGDVEIKLTATLRLNDEVLTKAFLAHIKELPAKPDYAGYLFAYFIGEGTKDGEQLYMASSNGNNPLNWNNLNNGKPVFTSHLGEKGVRDPSIVRSPDGDKFYMIATDLNIYSNGDWTRAQTTGSTSLLIWESSDLIHWSNQRLVKVSSDLAGNTWAPEAFYDKTTGEYVVFWASKIYSDASKSGSPNERMMYAKTRDFYTFTEAQEYYNPGYSVIDTTMIENNGKIYRFTKDERDFNATTAPNGKMVFEESGNAIFGNFTMIKEGIGKGSIPAGEGPLVFKANGENKWYLFIDYFSGGGYKPFYTTDLASGIWTPASSGYSLPTPAPRHGTVLPITAEELARITGTLPVEVAPAVSEVTNVTLDQQALALKPGQTAGLKATVVPDLAGNKTVLWSSSNESVAIVGNTGNVTAIGSGTAAITATTVDGGRIATAQVTVLPVIPPTTSDDAPAGWVNKDVTVTLTASDSGSGVAGTYYTVDGGAEQQGTSVTITAEGNHMISYWSVDKIGNAESPHTAVVQLDKTSPTITGAPTTSANASGWYPSDVTVHFTCTDALSGTASCAQDSTISTEGANQRVKGDAADSAGNTASVTVNGISIDKTAPTTSDNAPAGWSNKDVTVTFTASDSGSGVAGTYYTVDGGAEQQGTSVAITVEGNHTISYWSVDKVGNTESPHTAVVQIDKTAPSLNLVLDKTTLWPPNHQLITVTASVYTNDSLSGISSIVLTSITSNEPDNGLGDGDKTNDIQGAQFGTLDTEFMLRAEQSDNDNNKDNHNDKNKGKDKGRIYTVTYTAIDFAGNKTTNTATVKVSNNQSSK